MGGVGTPIIGRPRPLPGQRRADPDYTLNCEEPIYWDGAKWTGHESGVPVSVPHGPSAPKSNSAVKWIAIGVAVLVGLVALVAMGENGSKSSDELHLLPVRDGKLEFTLLTWNGHTGNLRVVTIGNVSSSYDGSDQKALDAQGREFDCDGSRARDIQPGGEFIDSLTCRNGDVPIYRLKVHDFFLSFGTDLILKPSPKR
jgi:hypothetical protein